jgi:hypothetical protein
MNNINSESFTMNEKTIVYIILLGLLLYLYYKKRDVMIIFAFIVLLGSTFIFGGGIREGAKSGKGKGGGGGGCSKIGFTAPKIDKKDIKDSLEKALKNIEKVANKHWPFDDMMGSKPKNDKAKETYEGVVKSEFFEGESKKIESDKEKQENGFMFILGCAGIYIAFIGEKASEEEQQKIMKDLTPKKISNAIKGGETYLDLLTKNHKTLEGSDVKKLSSYLTCLCKQWLQILKQYQKAKGSGDDE